MPVLSWPTKVIPVPMQAVLEPDSIIHPGNLNQDGDASGNRLVLGDNLAAMWALLPELEGRVDLIYTDPPFFTNRRFTARVGRGEDSRRPAEWQLADGYQDSWPSLDAYLDMLYPRLALMHRLLAPNGTLYLHLDWHASAYARLLLDEIFGAERLLNEIAWVYHGPSPIRSAFNRKHDTILVYTKGETYTFNVDAVRQPYNPQTVKTFASSTKAGFGKVPDLARGKVPEDWWYFPVVARLHSERSGYPTQKPEALLERVILASSNPGGLVADFFAGSGTAAVVAARLGRRFLGVDATQRAIHTARARLVAGGATPFQVCLVSQMGSSPVETLSGAHEERAIFSRTADGCGVTLLAEAAGDVEYWEVDPDWNGVLFQSRMQAVRPRRKGVMSTRLDFPPGVQAAYPAVRYVLTNGQQRIIEL